MVGTDFVAMDTEETDDHDEKPRQAHGVESCSSEEEFYECDGDKSDSDNKSSQSKSKRSSKSEKDSTNKSKINVEGQSSRSNDRDESVTEDGATGGESEEKVDLSEKIVR